MSLGETRTYDEFDNEFDDLLHDFKRGHTTEAEFHRYAEALQEQWEEEGEKMNPKLDYSNDGVILDDKYYYVPAKAYYEEQE